VFEAIPKDHFRFFRLECGVAIFAARGDELDLVVAIPMLEFVFAVEIDLFGGTAFARPRHDLEIISPGH
jgi:hypothetical protein